jgi:hypothetical protein
VKHPIKSQHSQQNFSITMVRSVKIVDSSLWRTGRATCAPPPGAGRFGGLEYSGNPGGGSWSGSRRARSPGHRASSRHRPPGAQVIRPRSRSTLRPPNCPATRAMTYPTIQTSIYEVSFYAQTTSNEQNTATLWSHTKTRAIWILQKMACKRSTPLQTPWRAVHWT